MKEWLQLKIPPAVQFILGVAGIWLIEKLFPNKMLFTSYNLELAVICLILAGIFGVWGLIEFYRFSTSVNPHKPEHASSLVTTGIYNISRNPMYVALLIGLLAPVFYWGNGYTIIIPLLFIWYMNEFQIKPEEKVMEQKFGDEFQEYMKSVRRWI